MRTYIAMATALALAGMVFAETANPNTLTRQEIEDGWILLFDGQTSFGWKTEVESTVANGVLVPGSGRVSVTSTTTQFSDFEMSMEYSGANLEGVHVILNDWEYPVEASASTEARMQSRWKVESRQATPEELDAWGIVKKNDKKSVMAHQVWGAFGPVNGQLGNAKTGAHIKASRTTIGIRIPAESKLSLRNIKLKPLNGKSIFNGKDLTGWKIIPDHKSVFTVTDKGELNIKNGNGDIQTEGQWDDFVLQLDVFSNGEHLNSGIFFRGIPGEFWSGYECQIRNEWKGYEKNQPRDEANEDRNKPVDFGTGGLYARVPTRRVVSSDREWFTVTVVADGTHIATWVNGIQCTDYTDNKKDDRNARQGRYTGPGPISLQGHDPTTDLSFRNIRVADLLRR